MASEIEYAIRVADENEKNEAYKPYKKKMDFFFDSSKAENLERRHQLNELFKMDFRLF